MYTCHPSQLMSKLITFLELAAATSIYYLGMCPLSDIYRFCHPGKFATIDYITPSMFIADIYQAYV